MSDSKHVDGEIKKSQLRINPFLLKVFSKFKKSYWQVAGVLSMLLLAGFLIWFGNATSMQSGSTLPIELYFKGQYSIDGGPWQTYVEGEHVPSTKGDVLLRGNLFKRYEGEELGVYNSEDLPAAFYVDHINLTFYKTGFEPWVVDIENPTYADSTCGEGWIKDPFAGEGDETIEILIHNPHRFGNEAAIDEMLSSTALWWDYNEFEKDVLNSGEPQRNVGTLLMLVSVVLFGIALFSSLIHISSGIIWLLGLVVLFAGAYLTYSAVGVSFWSESIVSNTTMLGISMMFYMLFLLMSLSHFLKATKKPGRLAVIILALASATLLVLPTITDVFFYDTWLWWVVIQLVVNAVFAFCLIKEFITIAGRERWLYIIALLPLLAFAIDALSTRLGVWQGGIASQHVFAVLFAVLLVIVLNLIPRSINAAARAKELEMEKIVLGAELAESRISTMMSQIRPHFIYNTLGSIEQLCELDPQKAGELVHDFAKYLRGNFGELDNPKPILMSQEMEHVHHYISIENVRFPDMTFAFKMNSADFRIPALTIQPIVENAVKHGLMRLQKGGTIRVVSYETDGHYCVSVVDDGVGFDTSLLLDDRKHVGLRNIRERLKAMVNGTLEIDSTVGVGTRVLIKIPKEEKK